MIVFGTVAAAPPAHSASVEALAWMTGTWKGPIGEQTLEEIWTRPDQGTLAAIIRITGSEGTELIELILIEEVDDTLVLRVRQWLPGYVPRHPEPQTFLLTELNERRVRFEAPEARELKSLTYTRPTEDTFNIDVETGDGVRFQLNLTAQ